ncbi:hypothetical protein NIIDMKKI_53840 [Mycobacterium kansasii]|uniref:Short chain dehydrogenase family protein n=1 Tax=Mycobacterium kansasii TaxID=1768 RepID=A0A7G1INC8_MYCKA|nr:hypothetical protein NIIDMKKI_53840 [Mycobacterium kansasii]
MAIPRHDRGAKPWRAYGQSKLANLHFAVELHRRLTAVGLPVSSLVAHPGLSNTDLQTVSAAQSGGFSQRFFKNLAGAAGMSAANGARPCCGRRPTRRPAAGNFTLLVSLTTEPPCTPSADGAIAEPASRDHTLGGL